MKIVTIRNMQIGAGTPKICVPIVGKTEQEILAQAEAAAAQKPDLLEWRADFYEGIFEIERICAVCEKLRGILGDIPLIFTIRTKKEGGNCYLSPETYCAILREAANIPEIDFIDVEVFRNSPSAEEIFLAYENISIPEISERLLSDGRHDPLDAVRSLAVSKNMQSLIKDLQEKGKFVIASNHHFHRTPSLTEMQTILAEMESAGADIRKLAVMPSSPEDVLALLSATVSANREGSRPVITMSMGALGAPSRICGEIFGSCVSFGTVGAASAPGQIEISSLRNFLEVLKL